MGLVWVLARSRPTVQATLRLMSIPFMATLFLNTTIHPWYALILLAFLPFLPPTRAESRWQWLIVAPWLYLSGTLPLSYLTYLNPQAFAELEWVRKTEWWPALAMLLLSLIMVGAQQLAHARSKPVESITDHN